MKYIYSKLDSISNAFPTNVTLDYTGTTVVALKTNDYLVQSLVNSLGLALLLISIIMAIMFRANSILFASLITNLIPIFTVLGILAWLEITIRPPTAMTFAVATGSQSMFVVAIYTYISIWLHYFCTEREDFKVIYNNK